MYDICIIGGGINGVSTALQCSAAGYNVVLFEQKKLANGASSSTSKLAHGGLRYLENLEISLVKESLIERNKLIQEYPDLVTPLPFVFPIFSTFDTVKIWAGLKLYDRLAKGTNMPLSKTLDVSKTKEKLPWLKTDKLKRSFLYYDALMQDKEMVQVIGDKAKQSGVEINEDEKVIDCLDMNDKVRVITSKQCIYSKVVVNLTGAWNKELTSPSKGVHLIINRLRSDHAAILINPKDKRVFFTIPYKGKTIIGTTDELYDGDPDNVSVTDDDRKYIIDAINNFSVEKITELDIIDEYVGLRPLAKSDKQVGQISRDFNITKKGRVFSMVGGKYTTHRSMCETLTSNIVECLSLGG